MTTHIGAALAAIVRSTRLELDISQAEVGRAAGVSRAHLAAIEAGTANATLDVVARVLAALGIEVALSALRPRALEPRQRDLVHVRISAYVQRRLETLGFQCLREVEIARGRTHGWIDIIAFHPATGLLLVIEIKSRLLDIGAIERQVAWYEREAVDLARARGWPVARVASWLLCLASREVDDAIRLNRDAFRLAFPVRALAMRSLLDGRPTVGIGRSLALIDPSRRRSTWLLPSRSDGRRSAAPYRGYAHAADRWRRDAAGRGAHRSSTGSAGR